MPIQAQAPITILGLSTRDKILARFWSQNQNASNAIAGLNLYGGITLSDSLLPTLMTGRQLSGTFYGTNDFEIQRWDSTAAQFEHWDLGWDNGIATSSNTVARVGRAEGMAYKTFFFTKFYQDLGTPMDGILKANGTDYLGFITGWAGTNYVYFGLNYFTLVDGVVTAFTGSTNVPLASVDLTANYAWTGTHSFSAPLTATNVVLGASTVTYGSSIVIDLDGAAYQTVVLGGSPTFSTSNRSDGTVVKSASVRIVGDSVSRTIAFATGIRSYGTKPTSVAANKEIIVSFTSYGPNEADTRIAYAPEP
jgi:hypothetical protein